MKRSKGKAAKKKDVIGGMTTDEALQGAEEGARLIAQAGAPILTVVPDPEPVVIECTVCTQPLDDQHTHTLEEFRRAVYDLPIPDQECLGGRCDNCRSWMGSWNPSYLDGEYCAHCVPLPV